MNFTALIQQTCKAVPIKGTPISIQQMFIHYISIASFQSDFAGIHGMQQSRINCTRFSTLSFLQIGIHHSWHPPLLVITCDTSPPPHEHSEFDAMTYPTTVQAPIDAVAMLQL